MRHRVANSNRGDNGPGRLTHSIHQINLLLAPTNLQVFVFVLVLVLVR